MMNNVIGTYTSIKGQNLVDFLLHLGVSEDLSRQVLGSRWTLKIYRDEDLWGIYMRCWHIPSLNIWTSFVEGEERCLEHEVLGRIRITCRPNSTEDGLSISIDTESHGRLTMESRFSEDGVKMTLSGRERSVCGFWDRRVKVEGSYIFDKGENIDAFYRAIGRSEMVNHFQNYKVHMHMHGNHIRMSEYIGELGRFSNSMELDVETPFVSHGDSDVLNPRGRGLITRSGNGRFVLMYKSKSGSVEEWRISFNKWGMIMCGLDKNSGVSCKFHMRRFWDMTGTYKMVKTCGFERFASSVAHMPAQLAMEMERDYSTRLIITDMGHGRYRHQLLRKNSPMDLTYTIGSEMNFNHPLLRENVTMTPTMEGESCMMMTARTSFGTVLHKMYFSNEFLVQSVSLPEAHMRYKMIFIRVSHEENRPCQRQNCENREHRH